MRLLLTLLLIFAAAIPGSRPNCSENERITLAISLRLTPVYPVTIPVVLSKIAIFV